MHRLTENLMPAKNSALHKHASIVTANPSQNEEKEHAKGREKECSLSRITLLGAQLMSLILKLL